MYIYTAEIEILPADERATLVTASDCSCEKRTRRRQRERDGVNGMEMECANVHEGTI